jgi:hypothetical protein
MQILATAFENAAFIPSFYNGTFKTQRDELVCEPHKQETADQDTQRAQITSQFINSASTFSGIVLVSIHLTKHPKNESLSSLMSSVLPTEVKSQCSTKLCAMRNARILNGVSVSEAQNRCFSLLGLL